MSGRLLAFLDLLAISVAVAVLILTIVPDRPFSEPPSKWYSFTVQLQRGGLKVSGTDRTAKLSIGFLLTIDGSDFDHRSKGNADRAFFCKPKTLALTCYFQGDSGDKVEGSFFIADDAYLLHPGASILADLLSQSLNPDFTILTFRRSDLFGVDFRGTLL